jgi:hypothetical protein
VWHKVFPWYISKSIWIIKPNDFSTVIFFILP